MNGFIGIVIITVSLSTLFWIVVKQRKNSKVKTICESYPMQVAVFLGKSHVTSVESLTTNERKKILEIDVDGWEYWKSLSEQVYKISDKFPWEFDDFIEEIFPDIKKRKFIGFANPSNEKEKRHCIIGTMTMVELSLVVSETNADWEKRRLTRDKCYSIMSRCPDGYKTYCEVRKNNTIQKDDIIRDSNMISNYEFLYRQSIIYKEWNKEQQRFCDTYLKILKECRPKDGRLSYVPRFSHIDKYGKQQERTFTIWVGFHTSFSEVCEERQTLSMIRNRDNLSKFESMSHRFVDLFYDKIYALLESLSHEYGEFPFVIFVNSSIYNWSKNVYEYHYKRLKYLLDQNGYKYCNIDSFLSMDNDIQYNCVMIVDFVSSIESVFINTRLVAEHFCRKMPVIGYYSFIKEYNTSEMQKYFKVKKMSEEEKIDHINSNMNSSMNNAG